MTKHPIKTFAMTGLLVGACSSALADAGTVCSAELFEAIEQSVSSGDGQGHGPVVGSMEWMTTIEFRLGVRDDPDFPAPGTHDWCADIAMASGVQVAVRDGPSFDCRSARPGSMEQRVCTSPSLSELDRRLASTYRQALAATSPPQASTLRAEQRGWISGRDECWKSETPDNCVEQSYVRRIAELQSRYRLVPSDGPHFLACDGNPANEVVVTYFDTEPRSLIAERGDQVSWMLLAKDSGQFVGRNEALRTTDHRTIVRWGYDAPEMNCVPAR